MTTIKQEQSISRNKLLGVAGVGWLFDAMDVGILSFVITALAVDWDLTKSQMGWIGSVNSIGMAVGALIFGIFADKVGRKQVFMWTLILFSVASGISAFTTTLIAFMALRFLVGMGLGGELPVASTLVSESVEAKERGRVVVLLESFWAAGWLIAALISYFVIPTWGWRVALLLTAIPAVYAIYLRWHLPDSPQFTAKAESKKRSIFLNIRDVWSKKYARSTLMLWVLWFTVVFSYYGMFLWLPSVMVGKGFDMITSFKYVLIMTLAQLPGYFTAAWFIEKFGRKFVLVSYLIGTAVSAFIFGNAETMAVLLTSGMLLSFFNLGAWGALYAYTPEQYPAVIRGTGAGMAAAVGRIGGIFGPLLVGSLLTAGYDIGFIFAIFCGAIIIGVIGVIFLGTETKQMELE
ncbi:MFS transporter [Lysinibacillus sphaericus]|uniref:MFS transporter n=4 Tax=Lysinibacillus TaxID=400634 RepID=A0A2S0JVQ0_LYSSH|nr:MULTISPECIES: MFS transporter [Lysinibacillus]AHN23540.1 major facilitator transporter [Lysinibacillus varians]AVK95215.1 MFS transporter [Lysinibacillus sphaericus]MED4545145.1 MFS transporter [Lysinibacillus sphaericus]TKI18611.1 MFS transporter [Lysinibacillus sphaericus]TKI46487.1 MFS transporter [Lysinibacillus tabacifolii]